MPKRECRLLLLSPRARTPQHVQEYKPFRVKRLVDIMREVAAGVAKRRSRDYDAHAVFEGFFFGKTNLDDELKGEIGDRVPSCLVECAVYNHSSEAEAAEAAKTALFHFAYGYPAGGKLIVLLCDHKCDLSIELDTWLATSDEALFAYLWSDLCGNVFKRVGDVIARRSRD
jgi:hypothetical protein